MNDIGTNWSNGNYQSSKDMIITISVLSSSAEGDEQHDGQKSNKYGQWLCLLQHQRSAVRIRSWAILIYHQLYLKSVKRDENKKENRSGFIKRKSFSAFSTKDKLRSHKRSHSDFREFLCSVCGTAVKNKEYLAK